MRNLIITTATLAATSFLFVSTALAVPPVPVPTQGPIKVPTQGPIKVPTKDPIPTTGSPNYPVHSIRVMSEESRLLPYKKMLKIVFDKNYTQLICTSMGTQIVLTNGALQKMGYNLGNTVSINVLQCQNVSCSASMLRDTKTFKIQQQGLKGSSSNSWITIPGLSTVTLDRNYGVNCIN